MKLEVGRKGTLGNYYRCDLTKFLDLVSGILDTGLGNDYKFYHYIIADDYKDTKCLAIRVPGGTVGGIRIDDNNTITRITIDTDYVIKSYPKDVNELVQKYIGQIIEFD